jgi:hypothetical protein
MTKHPVVTRLGELLNGRLKGNVIPHSWYLTPVLKHGNKTKRTNFTAIIVLGELVYWYRPMDDGRPRFRGRAFNTTYGRLAKKLGLTYDQAKAAVRFLEERGVIRVDLLSINTSYGRMPNSLHLTPIVDKIDEITYDVVQTEDEDDPQPTDPRFCDDDGDETEGVHDSIQGRAVIDDETSHTGSMGTYSSTMPSTSSVPGTNTKNNESREIPLDSAKTPESKSISWHANACPVPDSFAEEDPIPAGFSSFGMSSPEPSSPGSPGGFPPGVPSSGIHTHNNGNRPMSPDPERQCARGDTAGGAAQAYDDAEYEEFEDLDEVTRAAVLKAAGW